MDFGALLRQSTYGESLINNATKTLPLITFIIVKLCEWYFMLFWKVLL